MVYNIKSMDDPHHEHLIKEIEELFEPILTKSPQAIYIYLDDTHKTCNAKFAKMLGYKSIQAWVDYQHPIEDVAKEDQQKGITAYMDVSRKFKTSTLDVTWVSKSGKKIKTETTMVPFAYENEVFVIHFISEK